MTLGEYPPLSADELREIRRALDDRWAALDASRRDARGEAERRLLLSQHTIEAALLKLRTW